MLAPAQKRRLGQEPIPFSFPEGFVPGHVAGHREEVREREKTHLVIKKVLAIKLKKSFKLRLASLRGNSGKG